MLFPFISNLNCSRNKDFKARTSLPKTWNEPGPRFQKPWMNLDLASKNLWWSFHSWFTNARIYSHFGHFWKWKSVQFRISWSPLIIILIIVKWFIKLCYEVAAKLNHFIVKKQSNLLNKFSAAHLKICLLKRHSFQIIIRVKVKVEL